MSAVDLEKYSSLPDSAKAMFQEFNNSIDVDSGRPKAGEFTSDISTQELEWIAGEVLFECSDFNADQRVAAAKAIAAKRSVSNNRSIPLLNRYMSSLVSMANVHPDSVLDFDARKDFLSASHEYVQNVDKALGTGAGLGGYVDRVVKSYDMHLESMELPQPESRIASLLLGAKALRFSNYIHKGSHLSMRRKLHKAVRVADTQI